MAKEHITAETYKLIPDKKIFPETRTEQTGYISPKDRIESLLEAGEVLKQQRAELYDFNGENQLSLEEEQEIVRMRNFDIFETHDAAREIKKKFTSRKKEPEPKEPPQGHVPDPVAKDPPPTHRMTPEQWEEYLIYKNEEKI